MSDQFCRRYIWKAPAEEGSVNPISYADPVGNTHATGVKRKFELTNEDGHENGDGEIVILKKPKIF